MRRFAAALSTLVLIACAGRAPDPPLDLGALGDKPLWVAAARNSTNSDLRLPSGNPLRSLGEMAGKVSAEYRPTVPDLLREALRRAADARKVPARYPEEHDARLKELPLDPEAAARSAREAKLAGALLLTEVRRWDSEPTGLLRLSVDFKLVRIADGTIGFARRVQKVVPVSRSGNPAEAQQDAIRQIAKELF